jgi:hypothetical protein
MLAASGGRIPILAGPWQLHNWPEIILPKNRPSADDAAKKKDNLWDY